MVEFYEHYSIRREFIGVELDARDDLDQLKGIISDEAKAVNYIRKLESEVIRLRVERK